MLGNLNSILISDPVDKGCADLLIKHGVSVTQKSKLSKEELIAELQKHDGLIVRSETKVTADIIAAAPNLKVIGRAGTGVDNIDIPAATRKGILVLNTPGGNSTSACELTCALISALARNVVQAGQSMKEGRWDRKLYMGSELQDKVLGVLGFGKIGREVAKRMQAYGMKIVAYDPFLTPQVASELCVVEARLEDIWKLSDYITVHTPLIPSTKNLINSEALSKCKKGVYIVNVARGGIVDEEALLDSIKAGHCAGAALDVFAEEPPKNPITLELIKNQNVIATPHLGASTLEAQTRVAIEIAEQLLAAWGKSKDYTLTGAVNAPVMVAASEPSNAPWIDLARRLGCLMGKIIGPSSSHSLESRTQGDDMAGKSFVHTAVKLGLLQSRGIPGVGLVNASEHAKELGIKLLENHDSTYPASGISLYSGNYTISGTVVGKTPLLLQINEAKFADGVPIQDNVSLYKISSPQKFVPQILSTHLAQGVHVNSFNVASSWIVIQTDNPVTVAVDGIESY